MRPSEADVMFRPWSVRGIKHPEVIYIYIYIYIYTVYIYMCVCVCVITFKIRKLCVLTYVYFKVSKFIVGQRH